MKQNELIDLANTPLEERRYCHILEHSASSISFVVDKNLTPPDFHLDQKNANDIIDYWLDSEQIPMEVANVITSSLSSKESYCYLGKDTLFQCILSCYARHRPLTLSPDVVWIVIIQAIGRHINSNPEKYRNIFVAHKGKKEIEVESPTDILSEQTDWLTLLNSMYGKIRENTSDEILSNLCCNFSTSSDNERIASTITIMDTVKSYFTYSICYMICGIPKITLTGSKEDWVNLLKKCRILNKVGLSWWYRWLKPILNEFARTAEGFPYTKFWKSIVRRNITEDYKEGGGCIPDYTTIDGWFLALFPYGNHLYKRNLAQTDTGAKMAKEMLRVGFKYKRVYPTFTEVFPMELWAGVIAIKENNDDYGLTPEIGWFVRQADEEKENIARLIEQDNRKGEISLQEDELSEILCKLPSINTLRVVFENKITLPEWFFTLKVNELILQGDELSAELRTRIKETFKEYHILPEEWDNNDEEDEWNE